MNRISFWAPDHARTATQLQTDVAHAKAGRKANPAAMNVQRNWRCAVKDCYLLLPAAPMPQQYSRLALAVCCDETAPGKGASRQNDANDQPLHARLLADPSGSRSGTVGLCRSEFRTGFRTGFRFRLRHPVSADPLWRCGKAGAGHGMASSCACSRTKVPETWPATSPATSWSRLPSFGNFSP